MKIAVFDGATIAPENGAAARGDAMGALAGEHHELLTSEDAGALIAELETAVAAGELTDPQVVAEVRTLARDQREARRATHRGGRGLEPPHLRGRRRVAQGEGCQRLGEL